MRGVFYVLCLLLISLPTANAQNAMVDVDASSSLARNFVLLSSLAFIPAVLVSMTSFIRTIIVLAMVRQAFGMPETPPNAVLISLAMFLTVFTMSPVAEQLNQEAIAPLIEGEISVETAFQMGKVPLKNFMFSQVSDEDIAKIYMLSNEPLPKTQSEVDIFKLTPAFILNELRVAFTIGFVIFLPFLLIDLVVASILLSLGMMMVPPATISLPIKVLMFVMIDGWGLVIEGVLGGFR